MDRYCSCNRGIGFSNRTSVVHNYITGKDICAHCGGVVPPQAPYSYDPYRYPDGVENEDNNSISRHEYFYRQAKTCSINGDHVSAIGFYKEVLRELGTNSNCEILSAIADEYEAMGDYASSEEYWYRCCAVKRYDSYRYIAGKGDFFYRRERYKEAIGAYEEALKVLNELKNRSISFGTLKCYAKVTHFIISSHCRLAEGIRKEKYHKELKCAIHRYIKARMNDDETNAHYISLIAWEIYEEDSMFDEALILIDSAIRLHPTVGDYKRKAIFIRYKLEINVIVGDVKPHHLDLINEALRILPDDVDNGPYLKVKGDILDKLGDPVKAKVCHALSFKKYDEVDKAEKQLEKLKSYETYINITGTQHYQHFAPFSEGTIVDLIKEPDNPHDPFAIRVEIKGETVGYVANSKYTLIKEVKSAADIKNYLSTKAEVQFILFNEWVIAKMI